MSGENNLENILESTDWENIAMAMMLEWNVQYYMWKQYNESDLNLIKSYVGLLLFSIPEGDKDIDIDFETVYSKYDEEKRNVINQIYDHFEFDDGKLRLSHTLLYMHSPKGDYQMCVFRQMRSSGDIHFIDLSGRVYNSWKNFVETNQLPKCKYMAPKDGIHHLVIDGVEVHETPASSQVGTICDIVACGAAVTAIGLGFVAATPVVVVGLGAGSAMYNVGQAVNNLIDRKNHKQSIAPTNLDSINCYVNIGTSALCGASALAFAKSASIINMSGKYSNIAISAIKGVNYTAAASTVAGVGLNCFEMHQKYRSNQLSWSDFANLCVNAFLMYGTISNVRQMRSHFSNSNANPMPPEGLSKSARRRWRKKQAKLSASGSSVNQNMTEVGVWDPTIFNSMIKGSNAIFGTLLARHCPQLYEIYNILTMIIEDFRNFIANKIKTEIFCYNFFKHGENLVQLLKNNSREIKDAIMKFLQRCGIFSSSESTAEISNIVDDGVIAINNMNEDISLESDSASEPEDEPFSTNCIVYEMILDLVKRRIGGHKIDTTEDLFSVFSSELSSVTNKIKCIVVQEYEEMLSNNIRMLGEKRAKIVLSQMGINSGNDFGFKTFPQIIDKLKTDDQVDISNTFEKQLNELLSLYGELFLKIADEDDVSSIQVLETCDILNNSIELVIQPVLEFFKNGKELYEMNIKYFGHESALVFAFGAMDMNVSEVKVNFKNFDEIIFIDIAKKKLNLSEIIPQLLPNEDSTDLTDESVQFTDNFKMETLLTVCNFYVQRIGSNEMTKVYSFITDKFIDHMQFLANQQKQNASIVDIREKLKFNIDILGKNNFNMMCRFLCETDLLEIINQVAETFKNEDFATALIAEYNLKMHKNTNFHAEYFKHLMADDEATIYTINVKNRDNIEELKQQAANLFNLNKYHIDVFSKSENLIILKHIDQYVVFQSLKNETETLIIQVDLSKKKNK